MHDDDPFDPRLAKALGHPLRLRLLEAIIDAGEMSPKQLAARFGQPLSTVSRHVRALRDLEFVALARTEQRRGTLEHFYRPLQPALIDDEQWDRLPVALRRGLAAQTFRKVFAEASSAGAASFESLRAHIDRLPLALDEAGQQELSEALYELLKTAEAIQRRADARRRPGAATGGSRLVLLHFFTPSEPADPSPGGGRPPLP